MQKVPILYEDLKNCAAIAREKQHLSDMIESLNSEIERCTAAWKQVVVQSASPEDRMGDDIIKLIELKELWGGKVAAFSDHVLTIEESIEGIPDPLQRQVLRMRYVEGKTFSDISDETHYTVDWLKKVQRKGLDALEIDKVYTQKHPSL